MENLDQILDAPATPEKRFEYAGFWIRFVAYFIDGVLLWVVNFVLALALANSPQLLLSLISLVIGAAYFSLMESSENQATLGKMALGLRVGDVNGERISVANALGRWAGKILSTLILFIGFMMAGWDEKNQALHDKLADTYVFYHRN